MGNDHRARDSRRRGFVADPDTNTRCAGGPGCCRVQRHPLAITRFSLQVWTNSGSFCRSRKIGNCRADRAFPVALRARAAAAARPAWTPRYRPGSGHVSMVMRSSRSRCTSLPSLTARRRIPPYRPGGSIRKSGSGSHHFSSDGRKPVGTDGWAARVDGSTPTIICPTPVPPTSVFGCTSQQNEKPSRPVA